MLGTRLGVCSVRISIVTERMGQDMDSHFEWRPAVSGNPKGWHGRGYLPHLDATQLGQFVTFRLADSVPSRLIERWRLELELSECGKQPSQSESAVALQRRIEKYADQGCGACHLSRPEFAHEVVSALRHFDGCRYRLHSWCVMPNHVHVLLRLTEPRWTLSSIVHSWKSCTAKSINRALGQGGRLWMPDYFDRFIRDDAHFAAVLRYIQLNPVKAGLAASASEWPWSGPR